MEMVVIWLGTKNAYRLFAGDHWQATVLNKNCLRRCSLPSKSIAKFSKYFWKYFQDTK